MSVGSSQEQYDSPAALVTTSSPIECHVLTQLMISSCHQASQGSSRLMSEDGLEARFKGCWAAVVSLSSPDRCPTCLTLPNLFLGGRKRPYPPLYPYKSLLLEIG